MLSNKFTPILGALILIALFAIFTDNDTSYIEGYEGEIKLLHQKVDSLHSENGVLRDKVKLKDEQFDILENKKLPIKTVTYEKTKLIPFIPDNEYQAVFTNFLIHRYPRLYTNTSSKTNTN